MHRFTAINVCFLVSGSDSFQAQSYHEKGTTTSYSKLMHNTSFLLRGCIKIKRPSPARKPRTQLRILPYAHAFWRTLFRIEIAMFQIPTRKTHFSSLLTHKTYFRTEKVTRFRNMFLSALKYLGACRQTETA